MTIYDNAIEQIENGAQFSVNFETKTLKVNNKPIIENGIYPYDAKLINDKGDTIENIEDLYYNYKYSTPSIHSERKKHRYFKALKADEIDDEMLVCGEDRDIAQAKLEIYVLISIINNSFKINKGWFWQSKKFPELVILKQWIT